MSNSTIGVLLLSIHVVGILVLFLLHPVAVTLGLVTILTVCK